MANPAQTSKPLKLPPGRRIVQISTCDTHTGLAFLHALCDDGSIWFIGLFGPPERQWVQMTEACYRPAGADDRGPLSPW